MGPSSTYGALLIGAIIASGLSGIVTVQTIVFYKLYPTETRKLKLLVAAVWLLDILHTGLISTSLWRSMITDWGKNEMIDSIPTKRNYYLTIPILVLAVGRLAAASEMLKLGSYILFREKFRSLFSVVLALSSAVDVIVTLSLLALLQDGRQYQYSLSMKQTIDTLILYTFELGSLTSVIAIVTLICWLVSDNNLVFLGIHFTIGKFYANSLLATLNTRQEIANNQVNAHDLLAFDAVRGTQGMPLFNLPVGDTHIKRKSTARMPTQKSDTSGSFGEILSA
ncbi:hypothetical protein CPC08DRAFT_715663 [Agrocybe pediades]|nr:hypothetical protein CPC08DRAFT_715663 [Agrocybe pediades]